jgi:hypothetical protein
MSHCFYNPADPVIEKEIDRYDKLLEEFGLELMD